MMTIIVVGQSGAGKTSVINRYVSNNFETSPEQTTGMTFSSKNIFYK